MALRRIDPRVLEAIALDTVNVTDVDRFEFSCSYAPLMRMVDHADTHVSVSGFRAVSLLHGYESSTVAGRSAVAIGDSAATGERVTESTARATMNEFVVKSLILPRLGAMYFIARGLHCYVGDTRVVDVFKRLYLRRDLVPFLAGAQVTITAARLLECTSFEGFTAETNPSLEDVRAAMLSLSPRRARAVLRHVTSACTLPSITREDYIVVERSDRSDTRLWRTSTCARTMFVPSGTANRVTPDELRENLMESIAGAGVAFAD